VILAKEAYTLYTKQKQLLLLALKILDIILTCLSNIVKKYDVLDTRSYKQTESEKWEHAGCLTKQSPFYTSDEIQEMAEYQSTEHNNGDMQQQHVNILTCVLMQCSDFDQLTAA
jgi:hypothetical protein